MKIYDSVQIKIQEQRAVDQGTSFLQLMENAGQAAAQSILLSFPNVRRTLILCGKGNNAGDGLVIARILARHGWKVDILFLLGMELSPLSMENLKCLPQTVSYVLAYEIEQNFYDMVIDGVFGTGFKGELTADIQQVFAHVNHMQAIKVALDIPSGLNCDNGHVSRQTFIADVTYTFAAFKPALLLENLQYIYGKVICLDIGIE